MAYRNVSRAELCQATHMSRGSYYNRMNGSRAWSAAEVADAAKALGVPVQTLYDGLPLDGGDGRARRDSNSQPSDPKSDVGDQYGRIVQFPAPTKPLLSLVRGGVA